MKKTGEQEVEPKPVQLFFDDGFATPSLPSDENDASPPLDVFNPEARLDRIHIAMQKSRHRDKLVTRDIAHEVNAARRRLLEIWGAPTGAELTEQLEQAADGAISFLQALPFGDSTAWNTIVSGDLTAETIEALRAVLAERFAVFQDPYASEGFAIHGSTAAQVYDRTRQLKTPRKFLKR